MGYLWWYYGKTPHLRPPQSNAHWDRTEMPRGLLVLHRLSNCEIRKVWHVKISRGRTTMYGLLPLVQLLQSGPYSHNFTNREDVGPYCPKAHEQREKKYFGGHQGRPGPLPGRLSPIKTGIITPCPNQQCGRNRSTGQHRCPSRSPRAHQDCRPQKRHANSHWEQIFF